MPVFLQAMNKIFVMKTQIWSTPTCFTTVCKVHDIVFLADQSANVRNASHLSFQTVLPKSGVLDGNCIITIFLSKICQIFNKNLVIDTVAIQDTSFRQKCLKLRCEAFYTLGRLVSKKDNVMHLCTLGKTSRCWLDLCFHVTKIWLIAW